MFICHVWILLPQWIWLMTWVTLRDRDKIDLYQTTTRVDWYSYEPLSLSLTTFHKDLGPVSISRPSFPDMGIPMLKIRWSRDRLIFNMGIPILVRRHLYIETASWKFQMIFSLSYVYHQDIFTTRPTNSLDEIQTLTATKQYKKYTPFVRYLERIGCVAEVTLTTILSNFNKVQAVNSIDEYCLNNLFIKCPWWCHDMKILSVLLALCEGNPPVTRTVMWNFDGCFDVTPNKVFNKNSQVVGNFRCLDDTHVKSL